MKLFLLFSITFTLIIFSRCSPSQNQDDEWLIKPVYDSVKLFKNNFASVSINGKWGFINKNGKEICPPKYYLTWDFYNGLAKISNSNDKLGFINENGEEIIATKYDEVIQCKCRKLVCLKENNKWKIADYETNTIYLSSLEDVIVYRDKGDDYCEEIIAVKEEGKWGFIDKNDDLLVPQYQHTSDQLYDDSLIIVKEEDKWGFINYELKTIIPTQYDEVSWGFRNDIACVKKGNKAGLINLKGKALTDFKYEEIKKAYYNSNIMQVKYQNKWGFINQQGEEVIKPKYNEVSHFIDGISAVKMHEKWGIIDMSGRLIIPYMYDVIEINSKDLIAVRDNDNVKKWGFINSSGKLILPMKYDNIDFIWGNDIEKVFLVGIGKKVGLINRKGKEILPVKYDKVLTPLNIFPALQSNGKWGFYDIKGNNIIPHKYGGILLSPQQPYHHNFVRTFLNGKLGIVNKYGEEVVKPKYDDIRGYFSGGLLAIQLNNKCGFIDSNGKEVVQLKHENVGDFVDGFAPAKLNGKWGFIKKP